MPQNGDFLPPEFWYWSTIGLGFIFVSGSWYIIKRYVSKLDDTIKIFSENISKLTKNDERIIANQEKMEWTISHQEERLEKLEDIVYPVRYKKK